MVRTRHAAGSYSRETHTAGSLSVAPGYTPALGLAPVPDPVIPGIVPGVVVQNVVNATGDVVVNVNGLIIRNGKLTIEDEWGRTVAGASGFEGDWSDFISYGLYNARFLHGVEGACPAGRTGALPYWTVAVSNAVLEYFGLPESSTVFGVKASWTALAGTATITSDVVPVQGFFWYELYWTYETNRAAGFINIQPTVYWYDALGTSLGSTILVGASKALTMDAGEGPPDSLPAPASARYARVEMKFWQTTTHSASNWAKVFSISLRPASRVDSPSRVSSSSIAQVSITGNVARLLSSSTVENFTGIELTSDSYGYHIYGLRRPREEGGRVTITNEGDHEIILDHASVNSTYADERFRLLYYQSYYLGQGGSLQVYYHTVNQRWQPV